MGFFLILFNQKRWKELYYDNCTLKTPEEWNALGSPSVIIGTIYLTVGIISFTIYIPFMFAMLKPEFIQHSCYKFMFLLGCIDMFVIPCNGIIGGIQSILGLHYCTHPAFFYVVGCIGMAGWLTATCTCCLLAVDRFFEICFPKMAKKLFGSKLIYFWLSIPIMYLFYYCFKMPVILSITNNACYFDPYIGSEYEGYHQFYELTFLVVNSIFVVGIMGPCYGMLCIVLTVKTKYFKNIQSMSKLQRVMLLQSVAICFEMFLVATVYVSNQWIPIPDFLTKVEHVTWICVHGDTPIVYLLLNASLRKSFFKMIKDYTKKGGDKMLYFATSVYPTRIRVHATPAMFTESTQGMGRTEGQNFREA